MTTHEHTKPLFRERIAVEHPTIQCLDIRETVDLTDLDQVETPTVEAMPLTEPLNLLDVEIAQDPKTRSLLTRIKEHPGVIKATLIGGGILAAVQPVAAEDVNWTVISNMLEGLAGVMPSVSTLVMAVVPVLIILLIVGFITGLLDGIISAIQSGTKLFR